MAANITTINNDDERKKKKKMAAAIFLSVDRQASPLPWLSFLPTSGPQLYNPGYMLLFAGYLDRSMCHCKQALSCILE